MSSPGPNPDPAASLLFNEAAQLRRFAGSPEQFWPAFLKLVATVAGAARAVLIRRDTADGRWKQLSEWAPSEAPTPGLAVFRGALLSIADECNASGTAKRVLGAEAKAGGMVPASLAAKLTLATPQELCLVAVYLPQILPADLDALLVRIQLLADIPKSYQEQSQAQQSRGDVEKLAVVLDTLAEVNGQPRYAAAVLALCNSLASRLKCERVSLGWFERGFVKLQGISRTERFDRKMAAVESLEKVMEEALDQDQIVQYDPNGKSTDNVTRAAQALSRSQGGHAVLSLPMRRNE